MTALEHGPVCGALIFAGGTVRNCGRPAVRRAYGEIGLSDPTRERWECRSCFYRAYMKSRQWENLTKRLKKNRPACERCGTPASRGKNGNPTGLNVHHLTYERLTEERDEDLIVLCFDCHKNEHRIRPDGTAL